MPSCLHCSPHLTGLYIYVSKTIFCQHRVGGSQPRQAVLGKNRTSNLGYKGFIKPSTMTSPFWIPQFWSIELHMVQCSQKSNQNCLTLTLRRAVLLIANCLYFWDLIGNHWCWVKKKRHFFYWKDQLILYWTSSWSVFTYLGTLYGSKWIKDIF